MATIYHPQPTVQHPPFHKDHRNKCTKHRRVPQLLYTRTDRRTARQTNRYTGIRTDSWTRGTTAHTADRTDGWTERWTDGPLHRGPSERIDCSNIVCSVLWARLALSTRRRRMASVRVYGGYLREKRRCVPTCSTQSNSPPSSPHDTQHHPDGTQSRFAKAGIERSSVENGQQPAAFRL